MSSPSSNAFTVTPDSSANILLALVALDDVTAHTD